MSYKWNHYLIVSKNILRTLLANTHYMTLDLVWTLKNNNNSTINMDNDQLSVPTWSRNQIDDNLIPIFTRNPRKQISQTLAFLKNNLTNEIIFCQCKFVQIRNRSMQHAVCSRILITIIGYLSTLKNLNNFKNDNN